MVSVSSFIRNKTVWNPMALENTSCKPMDDNFVRSIGYREGKPVSRVATPVRTKYHCLRDNIQTRRAHKTHRIPDPAYFSSLTCRNCLTCYYCPPSPNALLEPLETLLLSQLCHYLYELWASICPFIDSLAPMFMKFPLVGRRTCLHGDV